MKALRTPDECFVDLPDWPFEPHYVDLENGTAGQLRVHYVDEGSTDSDPIVFLHGNPTWSYLWRHVLGGVRDTGRRVVAPDLLGLGRSDKPSSYDDYSVARHVDWMSDALVDQLGLERMSLVLHDWGVIIGLRLLHRHPDRVRRVVVSNGGLPARDPEEPLPEDCSPSGPLAAWQEYVRTAQPFEPWTNIRDASVSMAEDVVRAYAAPFPEDTYTIGARAFAQLLPTRPDDPQLVDNWRAWDTLRAFERPFLTIYGANDLVAPKGYVAFQRDVPGAQGQPHAILEGGGHFLQEDVGEAYTKHLVSFLDGTEDRS